MITFEVNETFPSALLTGVCGFEVWMHLEGTGTTTLYYDSAGNLRRESDRLSPGFLSTIHAPATGRSFSEILRSTAIYLYPEGSDIGDPATVILNGVQRTSGPGNQRIVGHQVYEGVIIDYTADGVPIVDTVAILMQAGQFDIEAVLAARCDALAEP